MAILTKATCDICGKTQTEEAHGSGFPGWGALHGIVLNGVANPWLCPKHLHQVAKFVDQLTEEKG